MASNSKNTVSRVRTKVRLINFNDTITEGYVFIAHGQRVSDLLNDDREFLPIESEAGEMRVVSKRAIMEIEILSTNTQSSGSQDDGVVTLISGNAYDILGAPQDADDATVRAVYIDKMKSVDENILRQVTTNDDLISAGIQLGRRYAAAYDAITNTSQIEVIAAALRAAQTKRRRFGGS